MLRYPKIQSLLVSRISQEFTDAVEQINADLLAEDLVDGLGGLLERLTLLGSQLIDVMSLEEMVSKYSLLYS